MALNIFLISISLLLFVSSIFQLLIPKLLGLIELGLSLWGIFVFITKTNPVPYLFFIGIIYLFSFLIHIINKKHIPIIISGIIVCFASYLIQHH